MCEFCEKEKKENVDAGEFFIKKGELYAVAYGNCFGLEIALGIDYCPMCGKKLSDIDD